MNVLSIFLTQKNEKVMYEPAHYLKLGVFLCLQKREKFHNAYFSFNSHPTKFHPVSSKNRLQNAFENFTQRVFKNSFNPLNTKVREHIPSIYFSCTKILFVHFKVRTIIMMKCVLPFQ